MARVLLEQENPKNNITYYMDDNLKRNLDDKVKPALHKKDKDYFIAIDGGEGSGKSTLAFQIGKYVDPTLDLDRVVFTPEEYKNAIFRAEKGQCVIYDEAFTGLSSRSALSTINRTLVSLMMQVRQKNLFVIIVLPTIFLLEKYVSLFRTKVLIHVYENKGKRGYFRIYSKKLKMGLILDKAAKTYGYKVRTPRRMKGRFYGIFALGKKKIEEKYREKKMKALESTEKIEISVSQAKYMKQRDVFVYLVRKLTGKTYQEIQKLCEEHEIEITWSQIRNICVKLDSVFNQKEQKYVVSEDLAALETPIPK